ncbi:MAG TPA: hypothetical protein VE959_13230 [Bryobacteraceae bacterium]|nr:hypothetical protein [Bryobacteraceae bacterium]
MRHRFLPTALVFLFAPCLLAQGIIQTAAGTEWVFAGDGKAASAAPLGYIETVVLDRSGNPIIADPDNEVVVRVNANGQISVLAGNGIMGFSGDNGPAIHASLNTPKGVAVDASGNLYIADSGNNRIRMVTPGGTITTFAGNGTAGYRGDNGPASTASLSYPNRIVIDSSGILYINDFGNNVIRQITKDGNITTFAGNGLVGSSVDGIPAATASLNDVEGIAVDGVGNLYLAEFASQRIRKVNSNGIITTVAGNGKEAYTGDNGPATSASLDSPGGVAVDSANNIYISDTNNYVIRKVNSNGIITTIAGNAEQGFSGDNGPALNASFRAIFGLAVDSSGNLYVADRDNFRVRRIDASGAVTTLAGNGAFRFFSDGTPARNAFLSQPVGINPGVAGNLLVADQTNNRVRTIAPNLNISLFAGNGGKEYSGDSGLATAAGLFHPTSVVTDRSGNTYISDTYNNCIRKVTAGIITTAAGNCALLAGGYAGDTGPATQALLSFPQGVAVDNSGNLYIADYNNNKVRRVVNGIITTFAGDGRAGYAGDNGPAAKASLYGPAGLAFDSTDNLYVADSQNRRIRVITPDGGNITTFAGGGTRTGVSADSFPATQAVLGTPVGVTVDALGNVYLSDAGSNRVRKVSTSGIISTVAGNGTAGFTGDGGPSTQASLDYPYGLTVDSAGNLYIGDGLNNRIREVLALPPSLQVDQTSLSFSAQSGGGLTDPQLVNVSSLLAGQAYAGLAYKVTATTGSAWLKLSAVEGSTPGTIKVSADPSGLSASPNPYQGTITITSASTGVSKTVSVSFVIAQNDPPQLSVGANALAFAFVQGASASIQNLAVTNTGGGSFSFSASASTPVGNWLTVSSSTGGVAPSQPGSVTVQADPTDPGLPRGQGTYTGTVVIGSDAGTATIPVSMTINALTQKILLSQRGLKFTAVSHGPAPLHQNFGLLNTGQGTLNWTATASTLSGGGWLTIGSGTGTFTAGSSNPPLSGVSVAGDANPPLLDVSIDPSNLDPNDYYGEVLVTSSTAGNSPQSVTVIAHIVPANVDPGPDIQPSGLIFTGVSGSNPSSQNIEVVYLAHADNYQTSVVTDDGSGWLKNAPTTSILLPGQPVTVVVYPDFTTLAAGIYHGTITFVFNDKSSHSVDVLAIVSGASGTSSSLSADRMNPVATAALDFVTPPAQSLVARGEGAPAAPALTAAQPGRAGRPRVGSDKPASLPGRDLLEDGGSGTLAIPQVAGSMTAASAAGGLAPYARTANQGLQPRGTCTPSFTDPLTIQVAKPQSTFTAALLDSVDIEATALDKCGHPVVPDPASTFTAAFSINSGRTPYDQPITFTYTGNGTSGTFGATWQPKTATQSPITITILFLTDVGQGGAVLTCTLGPITPTPLFTGVKNAASGQSTYVAPGGVVSIYGQQLADSTGGLDGPPFPPELNGTKVLLAGQPLPLHYVGDGQINAQLPFDLPVNATQQLKVQRGTTQSLPEDIVVAPAQPAVYTQDLSGTGAGAIAHAGDSSTVTPSSPAHRGEIVIIYCNGLGPVDPPVQPGTASPLAGPVSVARYTVSVTIGGVPADVKFAGLSPGTADLYQVNVQVPQDAPLGDQIPVIVSSMIPTNVSTDVSTLSSPPVTVAVQ